MMRRLVSLTVIALATVLAVPAGAHFAPTGTDCGFVSFQANTDHGAFDITATGVSCSTARRVVRSAAQRGNTRGYYCRYRPHEATLAHRDWRCRRGSRVITFVVS